MSFFPLVNDEKLLVDLDRWLLCQVYLALQRRYRLLRAAGWNELPVPAGVPVAGLLTLIGQSATTRETVDLRLPSFARIGRVIRRAVRLHGPTSVAQGLPYEYDPRR